MCCCHHRRRRRRSSFVVIVRLRRCRRSSSSAAATAAAALIIAYSNVVSAIVLHYIPGINAYDKSHRQQHPLWVKLFPLWHFEPATLKLANHLLLIILFVFFFHISSATEDTDWQHQVDVKTYNLYMRTVTDLSRDCDQRSNHLMTDGLEEKQ